MIKFEMKKLIKNKIILFILALALGLTVYTHFFKVNNYERQLNEGATYDMLLDSIIMDQKNHPEYISVGFREYEWSGMSDEFNEDYQQIVGELSNPFDLSEDELLYGYVNPDINYKFIKDVKEFINKYELVLTNAQREELGYLDLVYEFLDNKDINEEDFINDNYNSSANILFTSLNIYYGLIPSLIFIFIFIASISYDYQSTSIDLFYLSPVKKRRYIINKIFSLLILAIFYSIVILVVSFLLGALRGDTNFLLNYPLKLYGADRLFIKFYQYILSTIGLFILNLSLIFWCLALLFLLVKDNVITTIISAAIIGVTLIVTDLFKSFSSIYNPLHFNYPIYLLGKLGFDENALDQANTYIDIKATIDIKYILTYLFLILILMLTCFYLINKDIKINLNKDENNSNKVMNVFTFELYKSRKFLNNKLGYGIGGLFLVTILLNNIIYMNKESSGFFDRNITRTALTLSIENNKKENSIGGYSRENEKEFEESSSYLMKYDKLEDYYKAKDSEKYYQTYKDVTNYVKNLDANYTGNIYIEDSLSINPLNLINRDISEFSKEVNNKYRDILLEKNIKPLKTSYNRSLSWYDKTTEPYLLEEGIKNQIPNDKSSFMILYRLIYLYNFPILLILLSIYLYGSNYNRDLEKPSSLELVYLNPIDKAKYYDKKYIAGLFECIRYLFFCIAIVILIGLINDPKGTLNYPILRYIGIVSKPMENIDYSRYYEFISLKQYLFETSVLSLSLFLLIYTICHGLSIRAKSRYKVYGILSIIIVALLLLAKIFPHLAYLNPAAYFKINDVVDGSIGIKEGYLSMSWLKGTIINIVLALIAYLLGRIRASKTL